MNEIIKHNEWNPQHTSLLICTINGGPNLLCWDPQCCVGAHSVVLELNTRCSACVETQHISLHFNQCVGLNLQVKCLGPHYCVIYEISCSKSCVEDKGLKHMNEIIKHNEWNPQHTTRREVCWGFHELCLMISWMCLTPLSSTQRVEHEIFDLHN